MATNRKRIPLFTAIRDTREKPSAGWWFGEKDHTTAASIGCKETIVQKVDVGDYTIKGLEDVLCIERKASVAEIAQNCQEKRFLKQLEKMSKFSHAYILMEFSWYDILRYPEGSSLPDSRKQSIKIKGNYITSYLAKASLDYDINIIPCGDSYTAQKVCYSILKMAAKIYETRI